MHIKQEGVPADPFITILQGYQKPAQPDSGTSVKYSAGLLQWSWPVVLLTDSSMYVDKEALSCQAGQLSELHAGTQHLSGWLAEEESSLCVHLCGRRRSMCI